MTRRLAGISFLRWSGQGINVVYACGTTRQGGAGDARRLWLGAVLLLIGCGGGGDAPFALTITSDFATTLDKVTLSGSASLPADSQRAGGTVFMPLVTCQMGPHSMTWSNSANGTTGAAYALWDCPKDVAFWTAPGIPLVTGANPVTVTMTDSSRTAQATVTITRN